MEKLSLYVVDDHKLFREGMKLLLSMQSFVKEVHEASNGREFLDNIEFVDCDLVLMDIDMPEMNGIEATREALLRRPELKVIALSMYGDEQYYNNMISAGVKGFVLKTAGIEQVIKAVKAVAAGENFFSEELMSRISEEMPMGEALDKREATNDSDLSDRELEILCYVCKGFSNQEIAEQLFISKRTVDKHRANLLSKTGCRNTAALVMYAIKNNIIRTN